MNSVVMETSVASVVKSRVYTIDDILGRREPEIPLIGKLPISQLVTLPISC